MNASTTVIRFRRAALAAIVGLAGCATVYDSAYPRSEGWRLGGVVSVQPGSELERPHYWTCTRDLSKDQLGGRRYVLAWYVDGRYKGYYVAEVSDSAQYPRNAPVLVNVFRCRDAVIARNDAGRKRL